MKIRQGMKGIHDLPIGCVGVRYVRNEAENELDEILANNVNVHVEKLDTGIFWMAIYNPNTDERVTFTFSTRRGAPIDGRVTEGDE